MSTGRCLRRLQKNSTVALPLAVLSRTSVPIPTGTITAPISKRHLFKVSHCLQTIRETPTISPTHRSVSSLPERSDLVLENELLAIQDAAVADLEAALGKSLQEAVQRGEIPETLLTGSRDVETTNDEDLNLVEESESPFAQLRAAGIPSEDIVREARNVFGDHLPHDVLSKAELVLYRRLYGDPLPEVDEAKERWITELEDVDIDQIPENVLYSADGEELPYRLESATEIENGILSRKQDQDDVEIPGFARNMPDGADNDMEEIARAVQGQLVDQETYEYEPDEEDPESEDTRSHPLTKLGKFATYPRTTFFSKETFVKPVEEVMSNFSNRQLREMCERTFGGPGLPDSPLTPRSGRSRQQVPIPLEAGQNVMGQMEANAFMTSVMPPTYASILAVLTETRKRLGVSWLNRLLSSPGGPRVLDAGSGGVGILAWRDIVNAHWDALHSSDKRPPPAPESKSVVLTGSDALRHRAIKLLENTTFIPRIPDYTQTRQQPTLDDDRPAQQRKQFDLIIASHSLFPLKEEWERKLHVQNLWSLLRDDGGILIIVEKGIPRGFETVAAAREMLLERHIATPEGHDNPLSITSSATNKSDITIDQKTSGMIVAPCTNHTRCPLYRTPGISRGRKDICSFQQRYIRPPFLQRVLGAKDRNHDDVEFSYLSVMKGEDLRKRSFTNWDHVIDPFSAPSASVTTSASDAQKVVTEEIQAGFEHTDPTWSDSPTPPPIHNLPRVINQPLKRQAHVTMDLCTPAGEIRRWTIPKSFSRQAYRDARKARWGDLWALGAKTNIPRNLKTGVSEKDFQASGGKMGGAMGKAKGRKERLEMQAERILEAEEAAQDQNAAEEQELMRMIEEDDLLDEPDDDLIDMDTLTPKSSSKSTAGKRKQNHSKLNNINIFGKTATSKQSATKSTLSTSTKADVPMNGTNSQASQYEPSMRSFEPIETRDYSRGRYGEDDNLASWSEELDSTLLEDEARHQVSRSGRRPTTKNTQRLKRELRRLKRESSIQ